MVSISWRGAPEGVIADPVVVLSPHLDDAVLSVGSTISALTRRGARVEVVTVFAGETSSMRRSARWDQRCGFSSADEAVRTRRAEDVVACLRLGATAVWLPHPDAQYRDDASRPAIEDAVAARLQEARTVLLPGWPLSHLDHELAAEIALTALNSSGKVVGRYVEQPYAAVPRTAGSVVLVRGPTGTVVSALRSALVWRRTAGGRAKPSDPRRSPSGGRWTRGETALRDRVRKTRAIGAYRSQLRPMGRFVRTRIAVWELLAGGEALTWDRA